MGEDAGLADAGSSPVEKVMKNIAMQAVRVLMIVLALMLVGLPGSEVVMAQALPQVSGAWVRGMVAGQSATGAFMTIEAGEPMTLIGARSSAAAAAEVHEMAMEGSVMRMRPVSGIALKPGQRLELRPGGYHLMLTGVKTVLTGGEAIPLQLDFQRPDGRRFTVEVKAEVRALGAPATAAPGAHMHH
jgi:copper(I)-binding protein